jgi:sRNA-binding regulator protein Hfq
MRKSLFLFLLSVVMLSQTVTADTIHLKNGSVLKGKVSSFADDQFIIMLDTGSRLYMSKAIVFMGDVSRIDFDSAPAAAAEAPAAAPEPSAPAPSVSSDEPQPKGKKTRTIETPARTEPVIRDETPTRTTPQPETQQRVTGPPEGQPSTSEVTQPAQPEKSAPGAPAPVSTTEASDSERLNRKPLVPVKTMNVDVAAKKDWTSSGLIVKRGDHIRVTASGTITLDPVSGRTSGPEGLGDLPDPKKLMPDQPTGALIGVISSDNDDFIFIGRAAEFTATRDGLLFLSVNEGQLSDNLGSFKAVVEVLSQRK